MITMYDSVDAKTIPLDATVAAGYINGKFRSFDDIVRRVPHARHLSITVNAETDADFIDVEPGDVPPKLVPGWVKRQHAKGVGRPAIYADLTRMKEVLDELNGPASPGRRSACGARTTRTTRTCRKQTWSILRTSAAPVPAAAARSGSRWTAPSSQAGRTAGIWTSRSCWTTSSASGSRRPC